MPLVARASLAHDGSVDETPAPSGRPSTGAVRRVTRRQLLAGAAATTLAWAAPAVVKLDVALPQAAVSPPPAPGDVSRPAVLGRTIERGVDPGPGTRAGAAAADTADTLSSAGTDAWKLAGTASLALAAGSLATWGPDRERAQNSVPADGPSDNGS